MHNPDPTHEQKFSHESAFGEGKKKEKNENKKTRIVSQDKSSRLETPLVAQNTLRTALL